MLLSGVHHVAIITHDTDRLVDFYRDVFDASAAAPVTEGPGMKLTIVHVGPFAELNVFEIDGNSEADRQTPMFGRGRIDHLALRAESLDAFETIRERLIVRGASDEFVTDFGPVLSVFFRDPDGLECEVCVPNPDAVPGRMNPPGTPAARYASS
jgi:catechol 2,3-dioxygenase-like lactoylglutathione lyase family enzyme